MTKITVIKPTAEEDTCRLKFCRRKRKMHSLCQACFNRWKRTGKFERSIRDKSIKERLLEKRCIDPTTGCWNWTGSRIAYPRTYGTIGWNGKYHVVHRLALHLWKGMSLDSPLQANHMCDNMKCFNPDHLYEGTQVQNMRDMKERGRNYQPKGEAHHFSKLTEHQVRRVRLMREAGTTCKAIGTMFGIRETTVCAIAKRRTWKHLA